MKKHTPLILLSLALLFLSACTSRSGQAEVSLQKEESNGFYSGLGKPQFVQFPLLEGEIGVVLRETKEAEEEKEILYYLTQRFELSEPELVSDNFYRFDLPEAYPREALAELAAKLRQDEQTLQAGLLYAQPETDSPLLVSDEIVVQFEEGISPEKAEDVLRNFDLEATFQNPFDEQQFLVILKDPVADTLRAANALHQSEGIQFAHPNVIQEVELRQTTPNDPFFGDQWHLDNTGQAGGTTDADIDANLAWDFTQGDSDVLIAVLDGGFDTGHPDLTPNLWRNPGEIAGNRRDDDGNGFVDDVNGWDFSGCTAMSGPSCGDANLAGRPHGTAVAGLAAARGDNNLGVSSSCPGCELVLMRNGGSAFATALAFNYAQAAGADVITNSWGYNVGTAVPTVVNNAITNAVNADSVVLFAMNNPNNNDCVGSTPDISSHPDVIAVSRASDTDRFDFSGFGNCMDVLAPTGSRRSNPGVVTTDIQGNGGYNGRTFSRCRNDPADTDYTFCMDGTSAATPITAGVAGLTLSLDDTLTPLQVRRLLQDTSDKVEHSRGAYNPATGFSSPASGQATHGYGRINAFEAARTVAPREAGGRGGIDVFIRDHHLDWGNTEQPSNQGFEPDRDTNRDFIPHWRSVDIRVDAPPYISTPITSQDFERFTSEDPISGELNRVYVRVHNRGTQVAEDVTVKLQYAFAGTALPNLPRDFWSRFPADSTDPSSRFTSLGAQRIASLGYSGASVANTPADASAIVTFDFMGPTLDASLRGFRHYCLFAVIDTPDDPVSSFSRANRRPDTITPRDNNVTHRNVSVRDPSHARSTSFEELLFVRNPFEKTVETSLELLVPKGWEVYSEPFAPDEPFVLEPGEEVMTKLYIELPDEQAQGNVEVIQWQLDREEPQVMGGFSYEFALAGEKRE